MIPSPRPSGAWQLLLSPSWDPAPRDDSHIKPLNEEMPFREQEGPASPAEAPGGSMEVEPARLFQLTQPSRSQR